jgi:hypothetical protein
MSNLIRSLPMDTRYAIEGANRQALIDNINNHILHGWIEANPSAVYLKVSLLGDGLGCPGCSVSYKTENDVPEHSVPCTCGNPVHWLIHYTDDDTLNIKEALNV